MFSNAKPLIGLILCDIVDTKQYVSDSYIQAVKYCGGLPIMIPLVKSLDAIECYVQLCDGFLFCGGGDVTPLLFGQEPVASRGSTNIALDIYQIRFMKQAIASHKPILGICRGMQVLNIACGGSIYQDISLQPGTPMNHMQLSASRKDISHKVKILHDTKLHRIAGNLLYTNSFHHQTINELGESLIISAYASDETIEAIELPKHRFVMGVQWHPECMYQNSQPMKELFCTFIRTCI
ncbi:gamma-glutamyl-gamma-aminobutyrate hydrolase family protein [Lachnospiraceae bacterium LCP25S3_G4]